MRHTKNTSFWSGFHSKLLFVSLCLIFIAGIYIVVNAATSTPKPVATTYQPEEDQSAMQVAAAPAKPVEYAQLVPYPEAAAKSTEIEIVSVGDIFLHTNNLSAAYDSKMKIYKFDEIFAPVAEHFKDADLSTAWIGGVYEDNGPYAGYPLFRSPATLLDALQNIGLDIALRTNHTLDYGTKGFNTTSDQLQKRDISQIGAHTTEEDSQKIFYYEKDNFKIAVVGYIYGMNGITIPKPWMIELIDLEKIKKDIATAKKNADFVVVALHFGTEYERFPSKWQKSTVQTIADNGADFIIGSHPHVIQTVDQIKTKDGRNVFVAYGLGNFYCGQRFHYTDAGVILKYVVEKDAEGTRLKSVGYMPTWVAEYRANGKLQDKILPSKEYIGLYENKQAGFLSAANYGRLKQTYKETVEHLDKPAIGFTEFSQ